MGIQGLIGLLENASTFVNIRDLKASVCVIDGYGWLHRACYGCADQLYLGQDTDQYVHYCIRRTQLLIDAGIKPIVVFDGQKLPAKELTHNNRQSIRHNMRQKIELLLTEGQESKAKELMRNCIEVTPKMAKHLQNALRLLDIDFIVAPFEADAQMAYLVNNGFADFVVTEDSDLLVYNCRLCLFKLDPNGNGRLIDLSLIKQCLGNGFDANKLRHMSILSGCDYLPNLPGIGLQRAKKFFKMTANNDLKKVLFKVPNYLKMSKKVKVSEEYVKNFIKADNTFKYQLVFCPQRRQLVPLTPYECGLKAEDMSYAGSHFSDSLGPDFAFQYAIGNIDSKSLKIIDSFSFEPKSDSIWSKDWINYKKRFTTNPMILREISPNRVLTVNTDIKNDIHKQRDVSQRIESQNTDNSRKRLKVNENRFIDCKQLLSEYSVVKYDNKSVSTLNCTQNSYTSSQRIYSRNIFKVTNDCIEGSTLQSKYFSGLQTENRSNQLSSQNNIQMKNKLICGQKSSNDSQYSLNSSGNTTMGSLSDIEDTDRSEISETSDEDIIAYNSFTNLKPKPLNSTFMTSSTKSDIRTYFQ